VQRVPLHRREVAHNLPLRVLNYHRGRGRHRGGGMENVNP
jgi:hypothetical protein